MVLSLMTLPTIIIATRAALKAVPPSIREAALGVGASKHQVVMHHVLPLAMPGILTGTIIGMAHALGETAPLLLIGMNAFIPSIENMGILEPATTLPTQIYSWADSPERGFVSRTSAAILVLLGFLVIDEPCRHRSEATDSSGNGRRGSASWRLNVEARPVIKRGNSGDWRRRSGGRCRASASIKMTARDVNVYYGEKQALFDVRSRHPRSLGDSADRPVRLR